MSFASMHNDYLDPDRWLNEGESEAVDNTPSGTDPYGELAWCVGTEDDFHCFDYFRHDDETVTLHAVINSETGAFIMDSEPPVRVPVKDAVKVAKGMVNRAMEWCFDNGIEHDAKGWNQEPERFWKDLESDLASVEKGQP